jgi:hypothetical protein
MAAFERGPEPSVFVKSVMDLIDRRVAVYAESFKASAPGQVRGRRWTRSARQRWSNEPEQLDKFEVLTGSVISRYEPPGVRRRGDDLVFSYLYDQVKPSRKDAATAGSGTGEDTTWEGATRESGTPDSAARGEVPVVPLAALVAAEVEFRGPLRLSHTQNGLLAATYEQLGETLLAAGLPGHAALSFGRALFLHRQNGDSEAEDRCGLARMRAQWRASPPGWQRRANRFSDLFCGYGYRPFRMLVWIGVQLALFTVAVTLVSSASFTTSLYLCLTNYLNPLGVGDSALAQPARALFVLETYMGTISISVFFALLVRRWFRL